MEEQTDFYTNQISLKNDTEKTKMPAKAGLFNLP